MKALRFAVMSILFSCVVQSMEAMADHVYGSSGIVFDVANNTVRGYSRTELDYDTAAYYTPYVCGELYKDGVSQVRACHGGLITASIKYSVHRNVGDGLAHKRSLCGYAVL